MLDTKIKGITGDEGVEGVIISSDKVIKCDMVIHSMGIIDEKQGTTILPEDLIDFPSYKKIFIKDKKIIGAYYVVF